VTFMAMNHRCYVIAGLCVLGYYVPT
jgi:hypothetical protein